MSASYTQFHRRLDKLEKLVAKKFPLPLFLWIEGQNKESEEDLQAMNAQERMVMKILFVDPDPDRFRSPEENVMKESNAAPDHSFKEPLYPLPRIT